MGSFRRLKQVEAVGSLKYSRSKVMTFEREREREKTRRERVRKTERESEKEIVWKLQKVEAS